MHKTHTQNLHGNYPEELDFKKSPIFYFHRNTTDLYETLKLVVHLKKVPFHNSFTQ